MKNTVSSYQQLLAFLEDLPELRREALAADLLARCSEPETEADEPPQPDGVPEWDALFNDPRSGPCIDDICAEGEAQSGEERPLSELIAKYRQPAEE